MNSNSSKSKTVYFIVLTIMFSFSNCTKSKSRLEQAFELAGDNRIELEKVINIYSKEAKDSLKLKAAYYLIENMPYHFTDEECFVSPKGDKYRPDISLFDGKDAVKKHCDSLGHIGYEIYKKRIYDVKELSSDFLIKNIELAFEVWEKPWAKDIPFEVFCRYILPYKAQIENNSYLRQEIMERFMPILDSANVKTPLEACTLLNERLKEIMKYKGRGLSFYPTIDETYKSGISECEGLCNLGTFIMRAVGIPVAVDQTIWVKMDNGHSWCAVWDNGKFHSFGPGEDQPDVHAQLFSKYRHRRPAKVYRHNFDPYQPRTKLKDDGYITHLKSPLLEDVTAEYLNPVITVKVSIDMKKQNKTKSNLVYLCTFNHYQWTPIAIGEEVDSICTFKDVVGDNLFVVSEAFSENTLQQITIPFYVSEDGEIRKFIPDLKEKETFTFNKRPKKRTQPHTLQYWDVETERFMPIDYIASTDTTQTYNQIPKNTLLWFTIPERIVNQRVFFLDDEKIKDY